MKQAFIVTLLILLFGELFSQTAKINEARIYYLGFIGDRPTQTSLESIKVQAKAITIKDALELIKFYNLLSRSNDKVILKEYSTTDCRLAVIIGYDGKISDEYCFGSYNSCKMYFSGSIYKMDSEFFKFILQTLYKHKV